MEVKRYNSALTFNANIAKNIRITQSHQPQREFLYNEVVDLIKLYHKSAIISNKSIEISNVDDNFIKILNNLRIKFINLL